MSDITAEAGIEENLIVTGENKTQCGAGARLTQLEFLGAVLCPAICSILSRLRLSCSHSMAPGTLCHFMRPGLTGESLPPLPKAKLETSQSFGAITLTMPCAAARPRSGLEAC